jgi:DNA-directed RNA polymerase specialized sigma24 family protein
VLQQCLEEVRRDVDPKSVEAFELFAWKGLSAQEVADRLGMTPNAVFIAKHRILRRIRDLAQQMEHIW